MTVSSTPLTADDKALHSLHHMHDFRWSAVLTSTAVLSPLARTDFATLAALAREIWLEHYSTIITKAQIEYMLAGRFTAANLERYLDAADRWMFVLRRDGRAIGYCSYALSDRPRELKLEQLYLLPALHGQGLGRLMLEHVEADARRLGCDALMLQVNKQNAVAIDVYRRAGFTVRQEVVVDIGNGFVMDDFILEKRLS
jgi:ribosomal protein S18 acetylase RimI-like enzyme